jgi:hypothetical protein
VKKINIAVFLLFVVPFVMGMGVGGEIKHKIPTPDKNFTATITDSQEVSTKVSQISFDGKTYLTGQRGNTTVTIPFEKISSVQVGKTEEEKKVSVFVTLKAGGTLNIKVEEKTPCYGSADFGNNRIEFKDIKKVEIHGLAPKETPKEP